MNYVDKVKYRLKDKINVSGNLLDLYLLLVLTKGTKTTLEDVHNAWSIWKNNTFKEHYSIVPFSELSKEVQNKDKKYRDGIIEVAKEFNINTD